MANHKNQCGKCGRFPFESCNASRDCPRDAAPAAVAVAIPQVVAKVDPFIERQSSAPSAAVQLVKSKAMGFTGDICSDCANMTMVRNGTCLKCNTCGGTSGCS
jgi:ribonucleoside-diphosphate reductase alpha chain